MEKSGTWRAIFCSGCVGEAYFRGSHLQGLTPNVATSRSIDDAPPALSNITCFRCIRKSEADLDLEPLASCDLLINFLDLLISDL